MSSEHVKHLALVIWCEVKEAIPDEHTIKPHVSYQPFLYERGDVGGTTK
jgi:hypothetical protein